VVPSFLYLMRSIDSLAAAGEDARRVQQALTAADALQLSLVQIQAGQRGYILVGDSRFLVGWRQAIHSLPGKSAQLIASAASTEAVSTKLARTIVAQIDGYVGSYAEPLVALARQSRAKAKERVTKGIGLRKVRPIRANFRTLVTSAQHASATRIEAARSKRSHALLVASIGLGLSTLFVLLLVLYLERGLVLPVRRLAAWARREERGEKAGPPPHGAAEAGDLASAFGSLVETLHSQKNEVHALLEAVAEGIIGIDPHGRASFVNPAALQLLGYDHEAELVGRDVHALIHHTKPDGSPYPHSDCRALASLTGRICRVDDEVLWRADGTPLPVEYAAQPIRENGDVLGAVLVFTDATERRAAEERRRLEIERLKELDRLKDDLISVVSHELRTPLTSIMGYLDLVLGDELSDEQRDFLSVSRRNADRLLHVVGDLLLVSTIEAGKLELDRSRVSLEQLATDAVEAASPRADERGVALALDCDAVPDVRADPARVGQVLDNLVSNAVKFTPPGGRVDVRIARNGSGLLLSVADTGTGIPVAEQPHVFERFFRAKAATRAAAPGTGLGLAIASGVVEAHGWKIKLESEEGAGTTVAVAVPQGDQLA